ncbi:hypothetical protein [Salinigranum sp.]|uniref:hypothetical protein n=1 Tax=Salinigranum sp. TaxID=1966351 RepID=UPI003565AB6A
MTSHATGERTVTITAYDVESESSGPVFSKRTMINPGEEQTYQEVATEPGRYRVVVETESLLRRVDGNDRAVWHLVTIGGPLRRANRSETTGFDVRVRLNRTRQISSIDGVVIG